jgi:hypothetical protein
VDKLYAAYKGAGVNLDKRHLEMLAKSQINHVQIDHDPEDEFLRTSIIPFQRMRERLAEGAEEVTVDKAAGRLLADDYVQYSAGTRVTPSVASALKQHSDKVKVAVNPPDFKFVMHPLERTPLLRKDWLARMAHRYIRDAVEEGAHFHYDSDLHGNHPVPGFLYGVEFGNGPGGSY